MDWSDLLNFAKKQAIVGIFWQGIRALPDTIENKPDREVLINWLTTVRHIQIRNRQLNRETERVTAFFQKKGFSTCLLKGQGNNLNYPDQSLRTSGDIDLWICPCQETAGSKRALKQVISFCRKYVPDAKACYHHIDFLDIDGMPVEIHYRPSYLHHPLYNSRLQTFFAQYSTVQFRHRTVWPEEKVAVPTIPFNLIYQLVHIYNHVIQGGIGLRQFIDYYYLLKNAHLDAQSRQRLAAKTNFLGLMPIARAVAWVMVEALGLNEKKLFASPHSASGHFLLEDILKGGNFGTYHFSHSPYNSNRKKAPAFWHNLDRLLRDARLVFYFPSECLWEPEFRIFHYFWRMKHKTINWHSLLWKG
uniref:nucleotidyltransferase family protein n=1 Tax=Phocaeicola vulgatus TaxID=821 RepID=UPI004025376A